MYHHMYGKNIFTLIYIHVKYIYMYTYIIYIQCCMYVVFVVRLVVPHM